MVIATALPPLMNVPLQRFVEPSISLPALKTEQDSKRLNDIACAQDEHQGHPFNAKLLIAQALDESKIPLLAEMHKRPYCLSGLGYHARDTKYRRC